VRPEYRRDKLLGGIALAGVGLSLTLFVMASLRANLPYCGVGSGCDVVQSSRWSMFLGLPITVWGIAIYVAIAAAGLLRVKPVVRWRVAIVCATIGLGVSLYLNTVAVVEIGAVCVYCLASLALIILLYALSWRTQGLADLNQWRLTSTITAIVIVGMMHLHYAGLFNPAAGPEDPYLRALAEHLSVTEAKFYGAYWCPHCQQQKLAFGASADRLPYVECAPNGQRGAPATACIAANIKNYPTWIINDRRIERTLTPKQLARYSGFKPEPEPPPR